MKSYYYTEKFDHDSIYLFEIGKRKGRIIMFDIEEYKKACVKWCRAIRIDKGISQHKIADDLNISVSAVSQFETGKTWSFPLFAYYFDRWGGEKPSWQVSKHIYK